MRRRLEAGAQEGAPVVVRSEVPQMRDWSAMRAWCADLLERRTGESADVWNSRVAERPFDDEAALRDWLGAEG